MRPAVDLERFDPRAGPGDGPTAEDGRPMRVLYAGTVGMAHGLDTLLDAAQLLERARKRLRSRL